MADPAWGSTSSLSDEEMARALCAFQHTEQLPNQHRGPHQQPPVAPLYHPRNDDHEMPQLAPGARAANGLSASGYPDQATYRTMPRSARFNEAASMLVEMHAPATMSDDWHRQQQRAIQEQIEQQQRELQAQMHQQEQRDMLVELQRMQAQIQQQHEQTQRQQIQRQVERVQQPCYSSGAGAFDQARWNNEVHMQQVTAAIATSNACGNGDSGRQDIEMRREVQQPGQFYDARAGRGQQLSTRSTPSFKTNFRESSQAGSTSRSQGMFDPQQVPQPAQPHLQARDLGQFSRSAHHEWGRRDPMSNTGAQTAFQRQMTQQFVPQQPQPYHSGEMTERSRPESTTLRDKASRSHSDATFLNGISKHFPTTYGPSTGVPATSTGAAYGSSAGYAANHNIPSRFNPAISTQTRIPSSTELQTQGQLDTHSKLPVPPTGTAVVPGVSLASQSIRLLCMQDLLNGVDPSRNQSQGNKQRRVPPKRKIPRKNTAVKRQRSPGLQNERMFQPAPSNRLAGGIQSRQGTSPAQSMGAPSKLSTPMYRDFMESRAARALQQTVGHPSARRAPVTPTIQSTTYFGSQPHEEAVDVTMGGPDPVKRKKIVAPPGAFHPSFVYQSTHQPVVSTSTSLQTAAKYDALLRNERVSECPQPNATESLHIAGEQYPLVSSQIDVGGQSDRRMDGAFGQQQSLPKRSVSGKLMSSVQPSSKVEVIETIQAGVSSKKRPRASSSSTQPSIEERTTMTGLIAGTSSSVLQTPLVSGLPRVENRTVVIFCKRDFMRYQAAKIWRKYQEQLKKHEEWREVRVAGKRTRYLNSRYDDELQRTHRRTYTRSGKPRRKPTKVAKETCNHVATSLTAEGAPVDSTMSSSSTSVENEDDENSKTLEPGQTCDVKAPDSGTSFSVNGVPAFNAKSGGANDEIHMTVQDASELPQQQPSQIEDEAKKKSTVKTSVHNEPSSKCAMVANATVHPGLHVDGKTSDGGGLEIATAGVASNGDAVADALSGGNIETIPSLSEGVSENVDPFVANAPPSGSGEDTNPIPGNNSPIAAPDESPSGNDVPLVTESVSSCTIESTSADLGTDAAPNGCIDPIIVADAPPNATVEITTLVCAAAKAASVDVVATSPASDKNMDTDASY